MTASFLLPRRRLAVLLGIGMLAACGSPPDDSAARQVGQQLVGTWLREYEQDGLKVRRVLVLQPDGHFREMSRIVQAGVEPQAEHHHAGEWLFDGTNLKRRYTRVDGRLPAAPFMPYATFELEFQSRHEFTGIDRVRHRRVRYERVADGTLP